MERKPTPSADLAALLAPLALAVAAYARTLRGELLFDDATGIVENGAIRSLGAWFDAATRPGALVTGRPLTQLTFAANYAAGRLDPVGYHAVNLALHLGVVLLVALLTLRVAALAGAERPRTLALAVAGIFAVHPLQSQAVAYVSQRAELLASALYVATLLLLLPRDLRDPGPPRRPWGAWTAALATFLLGLLAKPMVLTAPAALLAISLAVAPRERPGSTPAWRRVLPAAAALGALSAAFGAALLAALRGRVDAGFAVAGTSPWRYLLTELRADVVYLRLLAWPAGQSADWTFPPSPGLADPATLGAAAAILALAATAALLLVRGGRTPGPRGAPARLAGLGLAWFLLVPAVTCTFVPLADALVEHRVYLASWGILLAAAAGADALASRYALRRAAVAAWVLLILLLSVALWRRNAVWESREALWSDVLATSPESPRARLQLGDVLRDAGRPEEAIREYERALRGAAGNVAQRARILINLGGAQLILGRVADARRTFEGALHFLPDDVLLLANLAIVAGTSGDAAGAESFARRALGRDPNQPTAWTVLGNLALERGDAPEAVSAFDRALAADPGLGEAHYGRALALQALGRQPDACAALRAALGARLHPPLRAAIGPQLEAGCR